MCHTASAIFPTKSATQNDHRQLNPGPAKQGLPATTTKKVAGRTFAHNSRILVHTIPLCFTYPLGTIFPRHCCHRHFHNKGGEEEEPKRRNERFISLGRPRKFPTLCYNPVAWEKTTRVTSLAFSSTICLVRENKLLISAIRGGSSTRTFGSRSYVTRGRDDARYVYRRREKRRAWLRADMGGERAWPFTREELAGVMVHVTNGYSSSTVCSV